MTETEEQDGEEKVFIGMIKSKPTDVLKVNTDEEAQWIEVVEVGGHTSH